MGLVVSDMSPLTEEETKRAPYLWRELQMIYSTASNLLKYKEKCSTNVSRKEQRDRAKSHSSFKCLWEDFQFESIS